MIKTNKTRSTSVVCDDDSCLLEPEEDTTTDGSSAWLDVFCPQDSCEYSSPTQLP